LSTDSRKKVMNEEEEAEWMRICNSRKELWFEEVLRRYEAGERDFSLIKVNLSGDQCKDGYFSGVNLSGANFRESDLQRLVFYGQGINFSGSDLSDLDLAYAHFEDADSSGANLSGACLWRANFRRADLTGANFSRSDLQETGFHITNLSRCKFSGAKMIDTGFGFCDLIDSDFRDAKFLNGVGFSKCDLTRANFFGTDFEISEVNDHQPGRVVFKDVYFKDTIMPDGAIWNSED
jgi:uncharacterized protein YjbI with pentapeptide repeats